MARSIRIDAELRPSRRQAGYFLRASAPAAYVEQGTGPYIVAKTSKRGLWVPDHWEVTGTFTSPRSWRPYVRGQQANPFMMPAVRYVLSKVAI
jgi:hypothetical protein